MSRLTPVQRFQAKRKLLAEQNGGALLPAEQSLHIVKTELDQDLIVLKAMTEPERIEHKKNVLLPKWLPKVEQYLDEKKVFANPIFVQCIIWLFDVEQFDQGIEYAKIAIEQNQDTPSNWSRSIPAFVADTIYEWAKINNANGHTIEPYFSQVFELVKTWNVYEQIKAKWYKFAGYYLLQDEKGEPRASSVDDIETLKQAKELLEAAVKYNFNIGVKTKITEIDSRINKLSEVK